MELSQLPVENSAAEEAGSLGNTQIPGLASQNLEVKMFDCLG